MVQTFFSLLAELDDTNILYRGGKNGLYFARDTACAFLNKGGVFQPGWYEKAVSIHREFISRNLSPGGCADILACSIFIYIISDNSEKSWH